MIRYNAKWVGGRKYKLTCLYCNREFLVVRRDAKFCSVNCRKGWARRRQQIDRLERDALAAVAGVRRLMQQWPDLETHGALALERVIGAADVTGERVTERTAVTSVTFAGGTDTASSRRDKPCGRCGKPASVSPASGLCLDCIRQR